MLNARSQLHLLCTTRILGILEYFDSLYYKHSIYIYISQRWLYLHLIEEKFISVNKKVTSLR